MPLTPMSDLVTDAAVKKAHDAFMQYKAGLVLDGMRRALEAAAPDIAAAIEKACRCALGVRCPCRLCHGWGTHTDESNPGFSMACGCPIGRERSRETP
mgnify:CR=1 FL=1